jgi:hypothetical protein
LGLTGATGQNGATGAGATGAQGDIGSTGATGAQGATGSGATGAQGIQGDIGSTGATGAQGNIGSTGATGPGFVLTSTSTQSIGIGNKTYTVSVPASETGFRVGTLITAIATTSSGLTAGQGGFIVAYSGNSMTVNVSSTASSGSYSDWTFVVAGRNGATGAQGNIGATGAQGDIGSTGATGAQGIQGNIGATGAQGEIGMQGNIGATGAQGNIGATGAQGSTGAEGIGYRLYSFTSNTIGTGTKTFTVTEDASNSQYQVGMYVSGTGIALGAAVALVVGTTVTLTLANTSPVSGSVVFQGDYIYLLNRDVNYIRQVYPNPSLRAIPKYYAIFGPNSEDVNELTFIVGPTPDAAYQAELHFYYYPESIVTAGTSWLGDNFDSTLLYGSLVEAYTYMKGEQDLMAVYDTKFKESLMLLKNLGDGKQRGDAYLDGQVKLPVR